MCVVLGFFTYAEVTRDPPKMPSRSGLRTAVRRLSTPGLQTIRTAGGRCYKNNRANCPWLNLYGSKNVAGLDMFCVTISRLVR